MRTRSFTRSLPVTALALAAAAAVAAPATLAARDTDESIAVSYADLDLRTEAGKRELERRIADAAKDFCGTDDRTGTRIRSREMRNCVEQTKEQLDAQFAAVLAQTRSGG